MLRIQILTGETILITSKPILNIFITYNFHCFEISELKNISSIIFLVNICMLL